MLTAAEDRTADDIYPVVTLCPCTAQHLQVIPVTTIQFAVLRTDVRHQERLLLCPLIPFVITGGTHVPTTVPRLHIVERGDGIVHILIGMKGNTPTFVTA